MKAEEKILGRVKGQKPEYGVITELKKKPKEEEGRGSRGTIKAGPFCVARF